MQLIISWSPNHPQPIDWRFLSTFPTTPRKNLGPGTWRGYKPLEANSPDKSMPVRFRERTTSGRMVTTNLPSIHRALLTLVSVEIIHVIEMLWFDSVLSTDSVDHAGFKVVNVESCWGAWPMKGHHQASRKISGKPLPLSFSPPFHQIASYM